MSAPIYFDDALAIFASLIKRAWGEQSLKENMFLRDADGKLTFVVLDQSGQNKRMELAKKTGPQLKPYVDEDFVIATPDELFDDRLSDLSQALPIELHHKNFNGRVLLVDRRLVGADWLRLPLPPVKSPARLVFASIKGGVGRSTALCVLAAHLAAKGKRVLAVDLDLEAPGLGNMLLPGETLPDFGLLDYLVERHLRSLPLPDEFFSDLKASSWLGGGKGRVDVIPALGRRSLNNPENVLGKIARAYLAGTTDNKETTSFSDHIQQLLQRVAVPSSYDVVLIDARTGLHETAAAAVIGLGAEVFLFGLNQTQTFAGYELLFSHLATLPRHTDDDWRERLNIVHAKASTAAEEQAAFSDQMHGLITRYLRPVASKQLKTEDLAALQGQFETEWDEQAFIVEDDGELPLPIVIPDSSLFRDFDPLKDRSSLEERIYWETFGDFLKRIEEVLKDDKN